ncbi:hypothetical protein [Microvirga sp. TS319]|uniref:hypothetical protein n=1 Tax=Microvirga sp. TS319 TaxID=3241165 RepID=UPI00351A3415
MSPKIAAIVLGLVYAVPVIAAVWALWISWSNPQRLLVMCNEIAPPEGLRGLYPRKRDYAVVAAAFIGYGVFAYSGFYTGLSWMPKSWGSINDGEWVSTREALSFSGSAIAAILFHCLVMDYCRLKVKAQWQPKPETDEPDIK